METLMFGLMQDRPLLISSLIEHAARFHPDREIVSRTLEGTIQRSSYRTIHARAKQLARALTALGVVAGDRLATLAWNTHRHMELYYGVSGMGAILHTVNPRLFSEQIRYILNHAEDTVLCFDIGFAPLVAELAPHLPTVRHFVALTDRAHMPTLDSLPPTLCYEELLVAEEPDYVWPSFDERTASSLCYTSGTTGNPKGVLYSHRSTVLHSLAACATDVLALSSSSSIMLVVPLFHANAWGVIYAAAMVGAKLVLPGPYLDGKSVYELMRAEHTNFAQGVPTVWLMLFQYLDEHPEIDAKELRLKSITVGGSAPSLAMIERCHRLFDCELTQGWGMTELSPLGTIGTLLPHHAELPLAEQFKIRAKQGRGIWGVELKIVGEDGKVLPHDGKAFGRLLVRGPWISSGYFKGEGGAVLDGEGFFDTGDVATIDPEGFLQLVDRSKDVIKSGGEWISSIDLENAAMGHPDVAEAAVIGIAHPKWQERPLLIAIKKPGSALGREELLHFLSDKVAKWWLPDDVVFVGELPHTATGKLLKTKLRETFRDHVLPGA
jgi:fatty-acyl-CoA synthase